MHPNPSSDHVAAGTLLVNWFFLTFYSESSALVGEMLPLTFLAPTLMSVRIPLSQRIHHGSSVIEANASFVISLQASGRLNADWAEIGETCVLRSSLGEKEGNKKEVNNFDNLRGSQRISSLHPRLRNCISR